MPQAQDIGRRTAPALPPTLADNRLLDIQQMSELTGYSVAHLRRLYRTNKIPAPIRIGGRKCGWTVATARKMTEAPADKEAA